MRARRRRYAGLGPYRLHRRFRGNPRPPAGVPHPVDAPSPTRISHHVRGLTPTVRGMQQLPKQRRRPRETPREVPREGLPIGRAAFLATILAGVGGIAIAPNVASFVNGVSNELPAGLGSLVPGGGWRIYSIVTPLPRFVPATYALRIHGEVENPVTL